jgi:hypothetical protein
VLQTTPVVAIRSIVHTLAQSPPALDLQHLPTADWDTITVTAIALGLAPLLHNSLQHAEHTVPPMALAKLAVTRQAHAQRNQAIADQLAELLTACAAHHVDALVLKGALLAPAIYPDPALRPMNDIDLLFRPDDLPRVGPILESLGYCGKHKSADFGPGVTKHLSTYRRAGSEGNTPNPYLSAHADRTIEPHGSLEESWFGLKVDVTPGVWARAVPLTLHGQPAFRLSTADSLLHLAVHAVFHAIMGSSMFVQLYDIRQLLAVWGDEIHWPQLLSFTRTVRAQPFLYAGLYWANRLYRAPVPAEPLIDLLPDIPPGLAAYIHSMSAAALFIRTQHPPLTTLPQRLRRGLLDRRETARWAGSLRAKWRVWQTAAAFYKTDTAKLFQKRFNTSP